MKISVNNIELNYKVVGFGTPLICIHGNGEDHHTFDELSDVIKTNYQVFLIDSRFHGESQKDVAINFDLMANDMTEFCKILNLENVDILGFSDGGIIGLKVAILKPDLVNKLYICGANYHPRGIKSDIFKTIKKTYIQNKSPLLKLMIKEPKFHIKDLKNIKHEVFIFAGEKDVIKYKHTLKLHHYLKNSKLYIFPNESHESYVMHEIKLAKYLL
ncbi:MAG: alpha/beta hydrolase [Acholeplasmataceae bacterium]